MEECDRPKLRVRLLGPLEVRIGGEPLQGLARRKAHWLFALLALRQGRDVQRAWLAEMLWPEQAVFAGDVACALDSLRQSVAHLRKVLGEESGRLRAPTPRTLSLDLANAEVDLHRFDKLISRGDIASLQQATNGYGGTLLEGCTEAWILPEREERQQAYLAALEALAHHELARDDYSSAINYLRRAAAVEPCRESVQRTLMEALARSGDANAAIEVFRTLRDRLFREQNAKPSVDTVTLLHTIQDHVRAQTTPRPLAQATQADHPPPLHIPRPLTALIGREQVVYEIRTSLLSGRLVTLTGAGGIGKTRAAVQVGEEVIDRYPGGVWFVDLSGLRDACRVIESIAETLGVRGEASRSMTDSVVENLKPKSLLLILDNCEHLVAECGRIVTDLLHQCQHLQVLATSRQTLGVPGEVVQPIQPLSLPSDSGHVSIKDAVEAAAVQLFTARATAARPGFELTIENAPIVSHICHQLDGLPLAIELAAARMKVLTAGEIADRLNQKLRLLTKGGHAAPERQRTLEATIAWSSDLLSASQRQLFHRLSVFVGGFTLAAGEAVCAGDGIEIVEILDLMHELIDQSLVMMKECGGSARYRLLEMIREYAADNWTDETCRTSVHQRHVDYFLVLAEEAAPHLSGPDQAHWLERLQSDHDNLLAALTWSAGPEGEADTSLKLGHALWRFWEVRGYLQSGRELLQDLLSKTTGGGQPLHRARLLNDMASLALAQGDYPDTRCLSEESLELFRELGDKQGIAAALNNLGNVAREQGEYDAAVIYYEQSLGVDRELDDEAGMANALNNLGNIAWSQGKWADAVQYYSASLTLYRKLGDRRGVAYTCNNLGNVALDQERLTEAQNYYTESLEAFRKLNHRTGIAATENNLGNIAKELEDAGNARTHYTASLAAFRELGNPAGMVECLDGLARVLAMEGQYETAATLFGAVDAHRHSLGVPLPPAEQNRYERDLAACHSALDTSLFTAAWTVGSSMSLNEAVSRARM